MVIAALIIGGLVITGLAVVVLVLRRQNRDSTDKPVDYRFFYWMGIMLLPVGLAFFVASMVTDFSASIAIPFIGIGATYLGIGLANRDKWQKKN